MRLLTWNVASLVKLYGEAEFHHKQSGKFAGFLNDLRADIVCLQEAKIPRGDLTAKHAVVVGYESLWSLNVKGYCGVVTYVRDGPYSPIWATTKVFGDPSLDDEGRCLVTDHGGFVLFNVYVPNAGLSEDRQVRPRIEFKLRFLQALSAAIVRVRAERGKPVILVGDMNIAPRAVDVFAEYAAMPWHGYCEDEIRWMDSLLAASAQIYALDDASADATDVTDIAISTAAAPTPSIFGGGSPPTSPFLIDSWRRRHPTATNKFTVWDWRTAARARNEGTRIDLIALDEAFWARYMRVEVERGSGEGDVIMSDEAGGKGASNIDDAGSSAAASASTSSPLASSASAATAAAPADNTGAFPSTIDLARLKNATLPLPPPGSVVIVFTPDKWSDHAAVLLTTAADVPGTPLGHPPCSLSSRKMFPGLMSMFGKAAGGGGKAVASSAAASILSTAAVAATATVRTPTPTGASSAGLDLAGSEGGAIHGAAATAAAAASEYAPRPASSSGTAGNGIGGSVASSFSSSTFGSGIGGGGSRAAPAAASGKQPASKVAASAAAASAAAASSSGGLMGWMRGGSAGASAAGAAAATAAGAAAAAAALQPAPPAAAAGDAAVGAGVGGKRKRSTVHG